VSGQGGEQCSGCLDTMLQTSSDRTNKTAQRFVADAMLGKLAKWLRVMGIDVAYDPAATNEQLQKPMVREGRILLTRDRRLARQVAKASPGTLLLIESDYYHEQVRQVVQSLGLKPIIQMFTRCLRCNRLLQPAAKEVVIEKVPLYVRTTQTNFMHCPVCDGVYWAGTHRDHMLQQLKIMLEEAVAKSHDDLSWQSKHGPHQA
jgi:uncharacterized protein